MRIIFTPVVKLLADSEGFSLRVGGRKSWKCVRQFFEQRVFMKAFTFTPTGISIEGAHSLLHNNMPSQTPGLKELLVEVGPVSVNSLATKVQVGNFAKESKILGWGGVRHCSGSRP
jgi:hypothetical protein